MPTFAVIDAPSNLGLRALGVEQLPTALKAAGLMTSLNAEYVGRIDVPPHNLNRDAQTGLLHLTGAEVFARRLAHTVGELMSSNRFPLVLGGDCSIEIGNMLALRRWGRFGLFFLDGHADFYSPESESTGEIASMDLAIVSGRGPDLLTNIDGLKPYLRDEDVVAFGFRDTETYLADGSPEIRDTAIKCFDINIVRRLGLERALSNALAHVTHNQLEGFWIHLDADVLDDADMPAVDYRLPNPSLRLSELSEILQVLMASNRAVGLSITILNPLLDLDGRVTQNFVHSVVEGLRG
jgi:arginase